MERLCERRNSIVEGLRHHCWRGSASGKPIPFEAGRAFGTCAFDSRPLRQMWVCWGDWLPYRAVTPGLFGVLRFESFHTHQNFMHARL